MTNLTETNTSVVTADTDLDLLDLNDNAVVPSAELEAASKELTAVSASQNVNHGSSEKPTIDNEVYYVVDNYPNVELPQYTVDAILCSESLEEIQTQINYLEAELTTAQNLLHNKKMTLQNQAKQELINQQAANDESLVMNALEKPEMLRIMASMLRIMQQPGKAGVLLEALDTIENGSTTSAMTRLATTIAPTYNTAQYEPATPISDAPHAIVVEPIQTTAAPRARTKWVPN